MLYEIEYIDGYYFQYEVPLNKDKLEQLTKESERLINEYRGIEINDFLIKEKFLKSGSIDKSLEDMNMYFKLRNKPIQLKKLEEDKNIFRILINFHNKEYSYGITSAMYANILIVNDYKMIANKIYNNRDIKLTGLYASMLIFEELKNCKALAYLLYDEYNINCQVVNRTPI